GSGTDTSSLNLPNSFADVFDALKSFGGAFKFLGPLATAIDVTQAVKNIITWIVGDPQPIKVNSTALTQPLGDWKHAIEINDWNPGTILNIAVDPTLTTAPDIARWNNIQFIIGNPNQSSDSVFGVSVKLQQGSETEKTLFRLDGLGSSLYGYQSYNFATQKYQQIDQNNLAFFGTTAIGVDKINPLKNYTASNGFVFSSSDPTSPSYSADGSHLFYWNDVNNSTIDLNAARLGARSISIEFDSRSLGWSWDPKFISTLADQAQGVTQDNFKQSLTLDLQNSKLWIEGDGGKWKYFTFSQFDTNTEAYKSALLAKTFYQINGQKALISDDQQTANGLVVSLSTLEKVVPDLSKLQQSSDATPLTSLKQITYVEELSSGPKQGVNIYYKTNPTDAAVYKIFVAQGVNMILADESISPSSLSHPTGNVLSKQVGANPVASASVLVDRASLLAKEAETHIDIDLNNIVGFSLADILASGSFTLNAEIVTKGYQVILERAADPAGFQAWTTALQAGVGIGAVVEGLLCSSEFLDQCASKSEFIDDLYAFLLNRLPEAGVQTAWLNAFENGANYSDVVRQFIGSKEFANIIGTAH
ncbi:MAG: DUF4214 domain-containing protein, partial [Beijerinckiaceae bacterium]|nr:DUF4214 domain-containing protein [Beijerinckiaceae bacterium]